MCSGWKRKSVDKQLTQLWQVISIRNIIDYLRVNEKIPAHENPAKLLGGSVTEEKTWIFLKHMKNCLILCQSEKCKLKPQRDTISQLPDWVKWQSPAAWSVSRDEKHGNSPLIVGGKIGTTLRKFALTWYIWIQTHTNFKYIFLGVCSKGSFIHIQKYLFNIIVSAPPPFSLSLSGALIQAFLY